MTSPVHLSEPLRPVEWYPVFFLYFLYFLCLLRVWLCSTLQRPWVSESNRFALFAMCDIAARECPPFVAAFCNLFRFLLSAKKSKSESNEFKFHSRFQIPVRILVRVTCYSSPILVSTDVFRVQVFLFFSSSYKIKPDRFWRTTIGFEATIKTLPCPSRCET